MVRDLGRKIGLKVWPHGLRHAAITEALDLTGGLLSDQGNDFTGDGKTDIVGRVLQSGQWWAGISTGSFFSTSLWATWSPNVTWVSVQNGLYG
jgi:hypothetical protein